MKIFQNSNTNQKKKLDLNSPPSTVPNSNRPLSLSKIQNAKRVHVRPTYPEERSKLSSPLFLEYMRFIGADRDIVEILLGVVGVNRITDGPLCSDSMLKLNIRVHCVSTIRYRRNRFDLKTQIPFHGRSVDKTVDKQSKQRTSDVEDVSLPSFSTIHSLLCYYHG